MDGSPDGLLGLPLGELLAEVGARTTAPGGGAVAGVVTSLAGALGAMAARFAEGGAGLAEGPARLADRSLALQERAMALAERDLLVYAAYVRVRRAGSGPDELAAALDAATQVPLDLAEVAAEIAELAGQLVAGGNPRLRGDAAAAVLTASAAARSAAVLVCENLGAVDDPRLVRAAGLVARADAAERTLLAGYPALAPPR